MDLCLSIAGSSAPNEGGWQSQLSHVHVTEIT
jgi:hypothetical protein